MPWANGYRANETAAPALPACITHFGPSRSTIVPIIGTSGITARLAIVIARPSCTRVSDVWCRKYSIDSGIHTPLPTASIARAETNLR
jgi:hypothetical protein